LENNVLIKNFAIYEITVTDDDISDRRSHFNGCRIVMSVRKRGARLSGGLALTTAFGHRHSQIIGTESLETKANISALFSKK